MTLLHYRTADQLTKGLKNIKTPHILTTMMPNLLATLVDAR